MMRAEKHALHITNNAKCFIDWLISDFSQKARSNVNCADDIHTATGVQHGEPLRVLDPAPRQPHPHRGHRDIHLRPQIRGLSQVQISNYKQGLLM